MNVFEMLSFDFQEFVTSPAGILIIVGIICLAVGIVIFLKEGNKKKAPAEEVKEEAKPAEAAPVEEKKEETAPAAVEAPAVEPVVVKATEDGVSEVPVPAVAETLNIAEPAPAVEAPAPETLDAPAVVAPVVEAPAAVEAPAPVVEAPAVESLEEAAPVVYGGASPEVKDVALEEAPREIYGGANPLENTAPIPTAEVAAAAPAVEAPAPAVEAPAAPAVEAPAPVVEAPAAPAAPEAPKEEIEKLEF